MKKKVIIALLALLCSTSYAQQFADLALHNEVDHVQPMTGIIFWQTNNGDLNTLGNKSQLEFSYLIYSDIVEQEGVYDWSVVDNLLSKAAGRGRQVILRFRYNYPGVTKRSVPLYITEENGYETQLLNVEGSTTYIPDWESETLQDFTLEFYTKFSERYDNDPRLAFLQMGFGSYSEYHLYDGPLTLGKTFPSKAFQTTFLNHVNTAFVNTQWTISIDAASSTYTPIGNSNALKNLNFGLFDDSFLHSEHSENNNEYNRWAWLTFGEDRANKSVAGGELNYYSNYDQQHVLDKVNGPWGTTYEELSAMYDITYMIGNDQLDYQTAARIEEAGMANGYHYKVTAFSSDGNTTTVTIKNNGIAPIYYDAYPTIDGSRSSESLKGLISGDTKTFTINAAAAGEDLEITCDRLVKGQEIQFDANLEGSITGFTTHNSNDKNTFYPNPCSNELHIANSKVTSISIYNLQGQLVYETATKGKSIINVDHLKAGMYTLNTYTVEGEKQVKFLKK